MIDRHEVTLELRALDILLEVFLEKIVVQLIRRRELGAIEFLQPLECVLRVRFALMDRFQALIAPAIVPSSVAHRGSARRALFHVVVPFRFEKFVEGFSGIFVFGESDTGEKQKEAESE